MTRLGSPYICTNEISAFSEYLMDWAYAARTGAAPPVSHAHAALFDSASLLVCWMRMLLKIEPSPSCFHGSIGGMRVHGVWLETRSSSAKTGLRRGGVAGSRRCKAENMYWAGIAADA